MDFFDELKQEAERVLTDNDGKKNAYLDKFVQMPEEGSIVIRLLPPSHGVKLPFIATRLHRLDGKSYHCRKELSGGKWQGKTGLCPPCDHYNHLWSLINKIPGGRTASKALPLVDEATRIKPIERFYYNCVVRDDPSQTGVKILSVGKTIHKLIMQAFVGDKKITAIKAYGNICETTGKEGRDFVIIKKLKKGVGPKGEKFPEYQLQFLDTSPLGSPDDIKTWLANSYNLAELRLLKESVELSKALKMELGLIASEDTGYDPREYSAPQVTEKPVSRVERAERVEKVEKVVEAVEEPPFDPDEEDVVPDSDFLAELNDV